MVEVKRGDKLNPAVYRKVLLMVHELHNRGYQRLRIVPGMSASGGYWRCAVTPVTNISSKHGAELRSRNVFQELVARYTSGDENTYFGWVDYDDEPPAHLADIFVRSHHEIIAAGRGQDQEYADWFEEMLKLTEPDLFPIAYADWDLPTACLTTTSPNKLSDVKIPMPPAGADE